MNLALETNMQDSTRSGKLADYQCVDRRQGSIVRMDARCPGGDGRISHMGFQCCKTMFDVS